MGFFTKEKNKNNKEERLPTLPPLPSLPNLPSNIQEKNESDPFPNLNREKIEPFSLPSFPTSNIGQKMNQNTIKEAVSDTENYQEVMIPPIKSPRTIELNESNQYNFIPSSYSKFSETKSEMENQKTREMSNWMPSPAYANRSLAQPKIKKTEPLFIKLEKFEGEKIKEFVK